MDKPKFKFVDLPAAAELLNVQRTAVLDLVAQGQLRPKTGEGMTAIFLTTDVLKIAQGMGLMNPQDPQPVTVGAEDSSEDVSSKVTPAKRKLDQDPIRKVSNRLAAERKWLDVSEEDMREWVAAQEPISYAAIRKQINKVEDKLRYLLFVLNSNENQGHK